MPASVLFHPTGAPMLEIRNLVKVYPGPVAALRASTSTSRRACSACSARTAPASRRSCASSPACSSRRRARSRSTGTTCSPTREWLRARLGYLPQEFGFYPHLTRRADARRTCSSSRASRRRAGSRRSCTELLERVNLDVRGQAHGQGVLGRHAAAPRHRAGDRRRPAPRHRRRADGRPRSRGAAALLPPARRAGRRTASCCSRPTSSRTSRCSARSSR